MAARLTSELTLLNGSTGDPALFVDYPGRDDALLFDAGDNAALPARRLADLAALFITHHHMDHFVGLDRIVRQNLDSDKTVSVFGPTGTISRIHQRLTSYEFPFFPFQKLALDVCELAPGVRRRAVLRCADKFPTPTVTEETWDGPVVYSHAGRSVEATPVDHTVPCLAYAFVEHGGRRPDAAKLKAGGLRPGPWLGEAQRLLAEGAPGETVLEIDGGSFRLDKLTDRYFTRNAERRVAYVTDTRWNDVSRPGLLKLANKAERLYCDSFYTAAHAAQAAKHGHMTAADAAEFAVAARVKELVLIHFSQRYHGNYQALLTEARAVFPAATAEFPKELTS
ncbi:MAG: MBL fold metallo-hydrolase [Planctomycetia bacterium]